MLPKLLPLSFFLFILTSALAQTIDTVSIQFSNGQLEGTLSIADTTKKTPIVYIIAGSGLSDRDGNSSSLKCNDHLMLSDALLAEGISTLRVDKRMSGNSIFEISSEEDMRFDIFVNDAKSWIHYIDSLDQFSDIVVIGHSQGSLVGMLASKSNDKVDAFISLAGPSGKVLKKIREQIYTQTPALKTGLEPIFLKLEKGERVDSIPPMLNSLFRPSVQPFLISWDKYNPIEEITKLNIPVAIVQGTTDFQVSLTDAEELKEAYPKAELMIVEGMNHVMKEAPMDRMKNMATYSDLDLPLIEGFSDRLVEFIKSVNN